MNFIKKIYNNYKEKKKNKETEIIRLENLRKQFEKEPGIIRQTFEDETGVYVRVRMSHTGEEVWRWLNGDMYAQTIERYASSDKFKKMKDFVAWIKKAEGIE